MARSSIAFAAALALVMALSACAHNNPDQLAPAPRGYGARPGRAAFRNSTRRSATACSSTPIRPTSRRPRRRRSTSRPVAQPVQPLHLHDRRPCRRARHARIQLRPRRPPRRGGPRLSRRQGRLALAHEDDQLRQGAAGRDLRRHFLLVAESPRRHRAQRRA